jgi:nucleotide-binding universal stress UspA family protein
MVPVDFSETSASALPYAAELAARFRAEVILIHVTEPPLASLDFTYVPLEETNRAAEEMLSYIQRETFSDDIQTRAVIRSGTPFDEITRAAARERADLIVLTTRGWTGLKHVLLGSTAERIVRHASCPVLVARDKETTK